MKDSFIMACSVTAVFALGVGADARPVSLEQFNHETLDDSGFVGPEWFLGYSGAEVVQIFNSAPTVFSGTSEVEGSIIRGTVGTPGSGDDDYWGIVLGWQPGFFENQFADYILIDWKGDTQSFNFDGPISDQTFGGVAFQGLAVSSVRGVIGTDELWQHRTLRGGGGTISEIARGGVSGAKSWESDPPPVYHFEIIYQPERLRIYVNDALEVDVAGKFPAGRLGFYSLANTGAKFGNFSITPLEAPDTDKDGVADEDDACIESDLRETVMFGEADTEVPNYLFENGCTMMDLITPVADASGNHGQFVSGLGELLRELASQGLITKKEQVILQRGAARERAPHR